MKKLLYFFLPLLAFVACSKDGVGESYGSSPDSKNPLFHEKCASNEILYISTNRLPIDFNSDGFDATLIENTYIDGVGRLVFDAAVQCIDADGYNNRFHNNEYLEYVKMSDIVLEIGEGAFSGCDQLRGVIFGKNTIYIRRTAFYRCTSLESVTIPDSVTSIGEGAFSGCTSLTSMTIGGGLTEIGSSVFEGCSSLESVTIPDSVTSIGIEAFSGCTSLTSVTIPSSVTSIGIEAFSGCTSLTSVTIPSSVTSIGGGAFSRCTSLTGFYGKFASEDNRCLIINGALNSFAPAGVTEYAILDSVTTIGQGAFSGTSLTSVTIPDSVTSIEGGAFSGTSLTSVTIPDSVTTIGQGAFSGTSLTSVTIPDSVIEIGGGAFYGCGFGGELIINGKIVETDNRPVYEESSWLNGSAFTKLTIGNNVEKIGAYAFSYYNSLTNITIGDSVTEIGFYAFADCDSLTSVTIGNGVTEIYNGAFSSCNSLTSIYCKAVIPPSGGSNMLDNDVLDRKIYVPMAAVDVYKSEWSYYADYIVGYDFE